MPQHDPDSIPEFDIDSEVLTTPQPEIENLVRGLLINLGEDPERQGLIKTPARVAKALAFLTSGYDQDAREVVNGAIFDEDYDEIVLVRDINFFSLCEHHMLPFTGKAHVAYLPDRKVVGLSKIPRLVNMFARRLQVQERMTTQIANALNEILQPKGVAVIVQARHMCMEMRGVEKQDSMTVTSAMLGEFRDNETTRKELLSLVTAHIHT